MSSKYTKMRWDCAIAGRGASTFERLYNSHLVVYMPDAPDGTGSEICSLENDDIPPLDLAEIGLLIAGAPELLAALEEVTGDIEAYCNDHDSDRPTDVTVCLPRLRAAITAARVEPWEEAPNE